MLKNNLAIKTLIRDGLVVKWKFRGVWVYPLTRKGRRLVERLENIRKKFNADLEGL